MRKEGVHRSNSMIRMETQEEGRAGTGKKNQIKTKQKKTKKKDN